MSRFWDGNKIRHVQYEFSTGDHIETLYDFAKQHDFGWGFKKDGTSTIMVVNSPQAKAKFLKMADKIIGFDFPILTYKEYLALKKARWYAYEDMCITKNPDGTITVDRHAFSYMGFIQGLYAHSDSSSPTYWNIDSKTAKDIMMAFGFDSNGNMIPSGTTLTWTGGEQDFPYTNSMAISLWNGWWYRYGRDNYQMGMSDKYWAWR